MADAPDIDEDFAAWTAYQWSEILPAQGSTAAKVAIRLLQVADELSDSHARTLQPWKRKGIASIDDFRILGLLRHSGTVGISATQIARHLRMDSSTTSSRIARLEKASYIERTSNPGDQRSRLVRLAPSQSNTVDEIYQALVENHERFFKKLSSTQHSQLADMLGQV